MFVDGVSVINNKETDVNNKTMVWNCEAGTICNYTGDPSWCGCSGEYGGCIFVAVERCSWSSGGTLGTTSGAGTTVGGSGPGENTPWSPNASTVIEAPTLAETEIMDFFDNLAPEELQCISATSNGETSSFGYFVNKYLQDNQGASVSNNGTISAIPQEVKDFANAAVDAFCAGEVETFEGFIEQDLNNELELNPYLLLDIDCDQIDNWIALAQHTPSTSVKNKITDLHQNNEAYLGDWNIQYLENAGGSVVNMDYFAVKITTFPNNPSTGTSFTPNEFLNFFRKNINAFSGAYSQFEPYCEISSICTQETDLWNSTNPTSSIVKINIPAFPYPSGDMYGNDGVVVCSEYTNSYWNFMTMEAPYDSSHPVSGTRQFGIEENSDGSYNLYMRGVDRFENGVLFDLLDLFLEIPMVGPKDPFFGADELWKHIQVQLNTFLNDPSVGGVSTIVTPVTNRVNWEDVKDVLQGRKNKSDLGCN